MVSRHHARIIVSREGITVEDLRSKNGTSINDRLIEAPEAVSDGDCISFGPVQMTLRIRHEQDTTATAD